MAVLKHEKVDFFNRFTLLKLIFFLSCLNIASGQVSDFANKLDWWQSSVIYQIYPRSFKDSNDDGVGDLKGIEDQLQHFVDIGIDAIWLSPIYKSPMFDMGYDISNFTAIDPTFGSMNDFDSLVSKAHELGIKVVMDFVPNHSSDENEWFQKSIKKIAPYTDFYVWRDPKRWINNGTTPVPPNNWICAFQGPAWDYNPERKQFYLHQFSVKQPDLNYRSKKLIQEMKNVLRFWLDKGVDGFRMDAIAYLFENGAFPDEPIIGNKTINGYPEYYSAINHTHTMNQPDTYKILAEFRALLDSYTERDGKTRLMMAEAYTSLPKTLEYYGTLEVPVAHFPFNFLLLTLNYTSNARAFKGVIFNWLDHMPESSWPNWVLGNHDTRRIASRFTPEMVDGLNMLTLLLPGTSITYQGEEIGMEDTKIRWDQTTDIQALNVGPMLYESLSRDPERTPFQWNGTLHAGFSHINGKTWLPVNPNYWHLNVENQKKDLKSHLNIYKSLVKLRKSEVCQKGDFFMTPVTEWVLAFKRTIPGEDIVLVILNLNNEEEFVNLNSSMSDLPSFMGVIVSSKNSEHEIGDNLDTGNIGFRMRPYSAIVMTSKGGPLEPNYYRSASTRSVVPAELLVIMLCKLFILKFLFL